MESNSSVAANIGVGYFVRIRDCKDSPMIYGNVGG
jgi:hypothetical protein